MPRARGLLAGGVSGSELYAHSPDGEQSSQAALASVGKSARSNSCDVRSMGDSGAIHEPAREPHGAQRRRPRSVRHSRGCATEERQGRPQGAVREKAQGLFRVSSRCASSCYICCMTPSLLCASSADSGPGSWVRAWTYNDSTGPPVLGCCCGATNALPSPGPGKLPSHRFTPKRAQMIALALMSWRQKKVQPMQVTV